MVIQRWQSVLLLLAVVFMCIFCSTPFATVKAAETAVSSSKVFVSDALVLLILNLVIAALLFIAIFLFKNLKLQMKVTMISIVLIASSIVACGFILYRSMPDAEIILTGGVLLLICALICAVFGLRFMRRDHKLLRSYDRLR